MDSLKGWARELGIKKIDIKDFSGPEDLEKMKMILAVLTEKHNLTKGKLIMPRKITLLTAKEYGGQTNLLGTMRINRNISQEYIPECVLHELGHINHHTRLLAHGDFNLDKPLNFPQCMCIRPFLGDYATINSSEFRTRYTVSIWAKGSGNAVRFSNGTALAVSDTDAWHNIVVTSDGKKFVDGVEDTNTIVSGLIGNGTCAITIGGEAYSGKLSDFRIYAKKMSAEEIAALYKRKAAIDNSGKLIAAEIVVEDDAPASFSKTGVVTAAAMNNWTGESSSPVDVTTFSILQSSGSINASDIIEF